MRWKLGLTGDNFDLLFLAERFAPDPLVARDGEEWFLSATEIDNAQTSGEAHTAGAAVLARLNGIARLSDRRHKSVSLSGRVVDSEDGSASAVVLAGTVGLRARVSAVVVTTGNEDEKPRIPTEAKLAEIAHADREVARVVVLLDRDAPDQDRLWRVFERVRDAVGGEDQMINTGLASKTEMRAFRAWANRPDVSGELARHEVSPGQAPRRTLSDGEAWEFIKRVVMAWALGRDSGDG